MEAIAERLERLKNVHSWEWKDVAERLDLSISMLMAVKSGTRNLSSNAAYRLHEAEKEAGIPTPADINMEKIAFARDIANAAPGGEGEKQDMFDSSLKNHIVEEIGEIRAVTSALLKKLENLERSIAEAVTKPPPTKPVSSSRPSLAKKTAASLLGGKKNPST